MIASTSSLTAAVLVTTDPNRNPVRVEETTLSVSGCLNQYGFRVLLAPPVISAPDALQNAILQIINEVDMLVVCGGTGLGPTDITPQTLERICDYSIPGFGELLRAESLKFSLNSYLSRCGGYVCNGRLVLAIPGNPRAAAEQLGILKDLLPHAIGAVRGRCKDRRKVNPDTLEACVQ